ncbi:MAG: glutathione S-transferase family protein [Burkholderiales bacterium]|nr:glutathione S-transferase family protein [Burkholderiales bacterium]
MQLVIGNKNYSSWSMRPWVLMRGLGLPFEERKLSFLLGLGTGFRDEMLKVSPAARVPVLVDGDLTVWDSLAIAEYLHERFPDRGVWPKTLPQRTRARTLCAEMHAGFGALRQHCPMNVEASLPEAGARVLREQLQVQRDLARIDQMWSEALAGSGGPFLFGPFGAVDAYFAPVALRVRTYGLPLSRPCAAYAERLLAAPGPAAWIADALQEHEFVPEDEPYRQKP